MIKKQKKGGGSHVLYAIFKEFSLVLVTIFFERVLMIEALQIK
jgi:hypothetical protein